jgi:phage terminase large subunit-like protein
MRINYDDTILTSEQIIKLKHLIYKNRFIPIKPYDLQLYAIADENKRKLIGGSAYSGKSLLGAVLALQYFDVTDFRCLIVRRTYDDVVATGGIVDYLKIWLEPWIKKGIVTHNKTDKVFVNTQTQAKIFYNYMMYEDDKNKFKSRQYHRIIVDEASEILKDNLKFLNRSLRPNEQKQIPLALYYISNPAASTGIEYLNSSFVSPKGKFPYFEMNFWDNPYVDPDDYHETLSELSVADFQFQMGNWDYQIKAGDIFDWEMITNATRGKTWYNELCDTYDLMQTVRTWDIAASDKKNSDYTACTLIDVFKGNIKVIRKQDSFKLLPGKLEEKMTDIFDDDGVEVEQWIEKQPAGAGKIMNRYWKKEFKGYPTKFIPVFKNKVVRAGKVVKELKGNRMFFMEDPANPYLNIFTKQAVNFPNFEKITEEDDESKHDDRVDSVSLFTVKSRAKVYI